MSANDRSAIENLLGRLGEIQEKAAVKTVFGDPLHVDGRTVIPVARTRYGFGFGVGHGGRQEATEGGGGGGGMTARPVALIEISGDEVKIKPIPDVTRLALMGMALVAWNVFWIAATIRALAKRRD